jgi:hypothetical protein
MSEEIDRSKIISPPPKEFTTSGPTGQFHFRMYVPIVQAIRELFEWHGFPIKPTSTLARILNAAEELGSRADLPDSISVPHEQLFNAYCCARLANSVLLLDYRPQHRKYFSDLQNGDLNFWNSVRSKAKDTEWELFLWAHLNRTMPNSAELFEPDILLRLPFRTIGIACKKAYSLQSIFPQIEAGARQIRAAGIPGIVALSLDFLLSNELGAYAYIKANDIDYINKGIKQLFDGVWRQVGLKTSRKFLVPGRIIGVIFSVQSYSTLPGTAQGFAEICAARFQSDRQGPVECNDVMEFLHGAGVLGRFASDIEVSARLAALKSLRPANR